jgi:hypothetical protein
MSHCAWVASSVDLTPKMFSWTLLPKPLQKLRTTRMKKAPAHRSLGQTVILRAAVVMDEQRSTMT